MKIVVKHGIRLVLAIFFTTFLCIGCAYFTKQSETTPVEEPIAAPLVKEETD